VEEERELEGHESIREESLIVSERKSIVINLCILILSIA
jgi:hypothetical protein